MEKKKIKPHTFFGKLGENHFCKEELEDINVHIEGDEYYKATMGINRKWCVDFPINIGDYMFVKQDDVIDALFKLLENFKGASVRKALNEIISDIIYELHRIDTHADNENVIADIDFQPKSKSVIDQHFQENRVVTVKGEYALVSNDSGKEIINDVVNKFECKCIIDDNFQIIKDWGHWDCNIEVIEDFNADVKMYLERELESEIDSMEDSGAYTKKEIRLYQEALDNGLDFDVTDYLG